MNDYVDIFKGCRSVYAHLYYTQMKSEMNLDIICVCMCIG